jgi:hypothetical protein
MQCINSEKNVSICANRMCRDHMRCAKVKCDQCGRQFDKRNLKQHQQACQKCDQCDDFWGTQGSLGTMHNHIRDKHSRKPDTGHTCVSCNTTFTRAIRLRTHKCPASSSSDRPHPTSQPIPKRTRRGRQTMYKCRHCSNSFSDATARDRHAKAMHTAGVAHHRDTRCEYTGETESVGRVLYQMYIDQRQRDTGCTDSTTTAV